MGSNGKLLSGVGVNAPEIKIREIVFRAVLVFKVVHKKMFRLARLEGWRKHGATKSPSLPMAAVSDRHLCHAPFCPSLGRSRCYHRADQ